MKFRFSCQPQKILSVCVCGGIILNLLISLRNQLTPDYHVKLVN